jgi:hypothetical protein
MTRTVRRNWEVDSVLTNVTTALLSDPTGTYGVKRNDTDAVVVADGTAMTNVSTGVYEYTFTEPDAEIAYTAYVEMVYLGQTFWLEVDIPAGVSDAVGMAISYLDLCVAVGHYLGWGRDRSAYSDDQQARIDRHIRLGLLRFYNVPNYTWTFLRPESTIATVAPYATGTVAVASGIATLTAGTWPSWSSGATLCVGGVYYNVTARTDDTHITIDDATVAVDAGTAYSLSRYAYDLPADFSHFDGVLECRTTADAMYLPVELSTVSEVRRRLALYPEPDYPQVVAVRPKAFDPTVGQRYEAILWPATDAAYTFWYSYRVTPTMLSVTNLYPAGGTEHGETILEACLAAAERAEEGVAEMHTAEFDRLLAVSLSIDKLHHAPSSLGVDPGQEGESAPALGRSRRGQIYWDAGCDFTGLL